MLGLKPIKLLPARERVASALRKAIISKSIPEGAELTLENTAQELGVSVTPVREAFQILARDGLLEVKQNRCAIVLGVTERTIREHYQLRAALEGTACMLCCQNNADLSKIKKDAAETPGILRFRADPSRTKKGCEGTARRQRLCTTRCSWGVPKVRAG